MDRRRYRLLPGKSHAEHQRETPPLEGWLDVLDATHPPPDHFRAFADSL